MTINGIPDHRLDEIRLRLIGIDHRPWEVSSRNILDAEGRRMIRKGSRKAETKAVRKAIAAAVSKGAKAPFEIDFDSKKAREEVQMDEATLKEELVLFTRTNNATDDMLDFVAHAPDDIEELLREVTAMHLMVAKLKEERDHAVKCLQSEKINASRAEEKISDMRRAWRSLCKEMGTNA